MQEDYKPMWWLWEDVRGAYLEEGKQWLLMLQVCWAKHGPAQQLQGQQTLQVQQDSQSKGLVTASLPETPHRTTLPDVKLHRLCICKDIHCSLVQAASQSNSTDLGELESPAVQEVPRTLEVVSGKVMLTRVQVGSRIYRGIAYPQMQLVSLTGGVNSG